MSTLEEKLHLDYDIYDEPPSDDYIEGYCTVLKIPQLKMSMDRLRKCLEQTNAYAFIVTPYRFDIQVTPKKGYTCVIVYAIHQSEFEHLCFLHDIGSYKAYYIIFEPLDTKDHKAFFHKGWVRNEYDHTFLDNLTMKYISIHLSGTPKLEHYKLQQARKKPCYHPRSETDSFCDRKQGRNNQICARCPNCSWYDRYDCTGRCIKKLDRRRKK